MITRGSKFFYGAAAVAFVDGLVLRLHHRCVRPRRRVRRVPGRRARRLHRRPAHLRLEGLGRRPDRLRHPDGLRRASWPASAGSTPAFRDGDAEALAQIARHRHRRPPYRRLRTGSNFWPIITAFAVGTVIVGLAVSNVLFVVGTVGAGRRRVRVDVRAWAERATADSGRSTADLRGRLMLPIEVPVDRGARRWPHHLLPVADPAGGLPDRARRSSSSSWPLWCSVWRSSSRADPSSSGRSRRRCCSIAGLLLIGGGIAGGIAGARDDREA